MWFKRHLTWIEPACLIERHTSRLKPPTWVSPTKIWAPCGGPSLSSALFARGRGRPGSMLVTPLASSSVRRVCNTGTRPRCAITTLAVILLLSSLLGGRHAAACGGRRRGRSRRRAGASQQPGGLVGARAGLAHHDDTLPLICPTRRCACQICQRNVFRVAQVAAGNSSAVPSTSTSAAVDQHRLLGRNV